MIWGLVLFLLLFSFSSESYALSYGKIKELALQKRLWENPTWLALGHYKGAKSEADGEKFFLSAEGKNNPEAEFWATLESYFSNQKYESDDWHPSCLFPARKVFLQKELSLPSELFKWKCQKFEEFHQVLSAQSLSLVFSSYFTNTPASTFGHTLLRFKRARGSELLDHASNYAATVTTNNAFLYGVLGLTGGFRGEFSMLPYFYKIREYNDYESRDLWDYELNLSQDQVEMVVAHLWELSSTYFDYYYLTENCSYHILGLLEVANPQWRLQERTPYFVIPVDTVKVVTETPGLVKKLSFRPSLRKKFQTQLKTMDEGEKKTLERLLNERKIEAQDSSQVLDAAIDYVDFKYSKEILIENDPSMTFKNDLLLERSQKGVGSDLKEEYSLEDSPEKGHGSRRVFLGAGRAQDSGSFQELSYRFSLHDFLDNPKGHNRYSILEMGSATLRLNEGSKLWLENLTFINITSLSPLERFFKDFSWRASFIGKTVRDRNRQNYFAPAPSLAGGFSWQLKKWDIVFLLGTEALFHSKAAHEGYNFALGPELGLYYHASDKLHFSSQARWAYSFLGDRHSHLEIKNEGRFSFYSSWALGLSYDHLSYEDEYAGKILYYF